MIFKCSGTLRQARATATAAAAVLADATTMPQTTAATKAVAILILKAARKRASARVQANINLASRGHHLKLSHRNIRTYIYFYQWRNDIKFICGCER